jgi:hypothetical protein
LNGLRPIAGNHAEQERVRPLCEDEAGSSADKSEKKTFREKLANQARACGAYGNPNGEFFLPRGAACEKQVREIGTGDQENQGDEAYVP